MVFMEPVKGNQEIIFKIWFYYTQVLSYRLKSVIVCVIGKFTVSYTKKYIILENVKQLIPK